MKKGILLLMCTMLTALMPGCKGASDKTSGGKAGEPVNLSILVNMDWFFYDTWGGRAVDDLITEKTGIRLDITRAADDQLLPVLMASGELPDLIYTDSRVQELSDDAVCYELGALLAQYAPNMSLPKEQIGIAMNDQGKYYYLPNFWKTRKDYDDPHFLPSIGSTSLAYRKDILDETGLALPSSPAELETLLKKVKQLHPEIVPLALGREGMFYHFLINQFMLWGYGNYNLAEENGEWAYFAGTKAYREGMRFMNRLAQQGLLSPEMFSLKYEQYVQETQSGNVFMWIDDASNFALVSQAFESQNKGARAAFMTGSIYPSTPYPYIDPSAGWAGTFIAKSCKNVEAAVKLLEWMSTGEAGKIVGWGIEGKHYNLDGEGYPVYIPEIAQSWKEDYDATVRNTGIGAWFLGTNAWYESVRLYAPDDNPETTQYLLYVKKNQPMRPECASLYAAPNTDEAAIFAALNYTEANYYSRVIFSRNDAEFERMAAEMSAQLENQGLSKYNQWIRNKWQTVKTLYNIN
jgi:putative aldouronate transport system substrate-binding protein